MVSQPQFQLLPAQRQPAYIKMLLSGVKYAGKTRNGLAIALGLAGTGNPQDVIVIDSEKHDGVNPASVLFADDYKHMYQILPLSDHRPIMFLEALRYAISLNPKVILVESLTDLWEGSNAEVESLAAASSSSWDTHSQRRHVVPIIKEFFNEVRSAQLHIICTARMKPKTQRVRVGEKTTIVDLGDQIDFKNRVDREFMFAAELDVDHILRVTLSKVSQFHRVQVSMKDGERRRAFIAALRGWALMEAAPPAAPQIVPPPVAPSQPEPTTIELVEETAVTTAYDVEAVYKIVRLKKRGSGKRPIQARMHCSNAIITALTNGKITPQSTTQEVADVLLAGDYGSDT